MLLGPVRAVSYFVGHGFSAAILSHCFCRQAPWKVSIPIVAVTKAVSQLASLLLASLAIGQNLLALTVASIGMMLDKSGLLAGSAIASNQFLYGVFGAALALNCAPLPRCSRVAAVVAACAWRSRQGLSCWAHLCSF